jgi:putative ABC transport system substrate-binding protein
VDRREQLAAQGEHNDVAMIGPGGVYAASCGITYGPELAEVYGKIGWYVGKILGGAKPADLPVQRIAKLQLVVNLKIAKALGITVPLALLVGADKVIE